MVIYADTSFLGSVYIPDSNTLRAKHLLAGISAAFPFTDLHRLELRNAISLAVFQKRFSATEALAFWGDVEIDIAAGRLIELSLIWGLVFRDAEALADAQTPTMGARSLDILHLVSAQFLQAQELLKFDGRQLALAGRLGMQVSS